MKPVPYIFVVLLILLVGCETADNDFLQTSMGQDSKSQYLVLQERDVNYPLTDYNALRIPRTRIEDDVLSFKEYLGRSYGLKFYPFEDARNVGYPVLEIERYLKANPTSYHVLNVKKTEQNIESFTNLSRYETNTNIKKTVNKGFKLDLKLFSIGSKKTYTTMFKSDDIWTDQTVSGELSINYLNRNYKLKLSSYVIKDLSRNYIKKTFIDDLYYLSSKEFLELYGGFVLTNFTTGGKAHVLYWGQYKDGIHDEDGQRETNLNSEIEASYDIMAKISSNSSPGSTRAYGFNLVNGVIIGRKPGSSMSMTNKFQKIKFSLETIGGLPAYSQFTIPKDINSVAVDLSAWSSSLADPQSHTITKLEDEGLLPIIAFIEEDNLQEKIKNYYSKGWVESPDMLQEPYCLIERLGSLQQLGILRTSLVTRRGETIPLSLCYTNQPYDYVLLDMIYSELAKVRKMFKMKIVIDKYNLDFPIPNDKDIEGGQYRDKWNYGSCYIYEYHNDFILENMSKYVDPKTGKTYILTTTSDGIKKAYTLYGDYVINDYIFDDLIKNIPDNDEVNIDIIRRDYYIFGL